MEFGFSEQAPALPPPASADLRARGGNLSFVTFHLFSPTHYFFLPFSLSHCGVQLSLKSLATCERPKGNRTYYIK